MNPSLCPPHPKNTRRFHEEWTAEEPMLDHVYEQVYALHNEIANFEKSMQAVLDVLHHENSSSARNLLHYVAFRRHDVRDLQGQLSALGLSSLGRSEACNLATGFDDSCTIGRKAADPLQ